MLLRPTLLKNQMPLVDLEDLMDSLENECKEDKDVYSGLAAAYYPYPTSVDNRVRHRRELVNRPNRIYRHPIHPFDTRFPSRENQYFAEPNLPLVITYPEKTPVLLSPSELLTGLIPEPFASYKKDELVKIPEVSFQWSSPNDGSCPGTLQWSRSQGVLYVMKGHIHLYLYSPSRRAMDFGIKPELKSTCLKVHPSNPDKYHVLKKGDVFVIPPGWLFYATSPDHHGVLSFTIEK